MYVQRTTAAMLNVSEVTPESISMTSPELSVLRFVACQPPATHLGLVLHLREHTILFKPLVTLVLDYSHLCSLAPFQTAECICVGRPPPLPTQQKHLSPAVITRNKAELSHPSSDRDGTKHTNNKSSNKTKQLCNF